MFVCFFLCVKIIDYHVCLFFLCVCCAVCTFRCGIPRTLANMCKTKKNVRCISLASCYRPAAFSSRVQAVATTTTKVILTASTTDTTTRTTASLLRGMDEAATTKRDSFFLRFCFYAATIRRDRRRSRRTIIRASVHGSNRSRHPPQPSVRPRGTAPRWRSTRGVLVDRRRRDRDRRRDSLCGRFLRLNR